MQPYIDIITKNSFSEANQIDDFGRNLPGVYYAFKKHGNIYVYVTLISYKSEFCEAVYEIFATKKNPKNMKGSNWLERAKKGHDQLYATILRSFQESDQYTSKTDKSIQEQSTVLLENLAKSQKPN